MNVCPQNKARAKSDYYPDGAIVSLIADAAMRAIIQWAQTLNESYGPLVRIGTVDAIFRNTPISRPFVDRCVGNPERISRRQSNRSLRCLSRRTRPDARKHPRPASPTFHHDLHPQRDARRELRMDLMAQHAARCANVGSFKSVRNRWMFKGRIADVCTMQFGNDLESSHHTLASIMQTTEA